MSSIYERCMHKVAGGEPMGKVTNTDKVKALAGKNQTTSEVMEKKPTFMDMVRLGAKNFPFFEKSHTPASTPTEIAALAGKNHRGGKALAPILGDSDALMAGITGAGTIGGLGAGYYLDKDNPLRGAAIGGVAGGAGSYGLYRVLKYLGAIA
jgi:hypothetical protein